VQIRLKQTDKKDDNIVVRENQHDVQQHIRIEEDTEERDTEGIIILTKNKPEL
jgi:regulatory protein YycI of two-component signal transduction system YycFG